MKNPKIIIEKLFKQMIDEMPLDKYMEMTMYKFVKSDMDKSHLAALLSVFVSSGFCKGEFYEDKLIDMVSSLDDYDKCLTYDILMRSTLYVGGGDEK